MNLAAFATKRALFRLVLQMSNASRLYTSAISAVTV